MQARIVPPLAAHGEGGVATAAHGAPIIARPALEHVSMARLPRLTIPGQPHYVVQRGNNLQAIFVDGQDYASMERFAA